MFPKVLVVVALDSVAQLVGLSSLKRVQFSVKAHAWGAGSVPSSGSYKRQPIHVSLSHQCFSLSLSPSLPLSLKLISMSSDEDFKKVLVVALSRGYNHSFLHSLP